MKLKKLTVLIIIALVLTSCASNNPKTKQDSSQGTIHLSNQTSHSQSKAEQAKEKLRHDENINHVLAVNSKDKLVIAIEVPHMKRFQLKKIEKHATKKMKKTFPNMTVHLSTDKKIVMELDELENELATRDVSQKELNKKINKLIQLMNEQT